VVRLCAQYTPALSACVSRKAPSTPYTAFDPVPDTPTDRLVTIAPIELRCSTSRLRRTTVKLVGSALNATSPAVPMFMSPTANFPTLPVSRPPMVIGTTPPLSSPMRRV